MTKQTDLDRVDLAPIPTLEWASGATWVLPQQEPMPEAPQCLQQNTPQKVSKTAQDLIDWGEAKLLYFKKVDRLPKDFVSQPWPQDTSIIPTTILKMVAAVRQEFPEAEFYLWHPEKPVQPPVKIPWKQIFGVFLMLGAVMAVAAAAILLAALAASVGVFLLLGLALAAFDPWVVAKINGEYVCLAVYYD